VVHRDLKPHNLFVCRRRDGSDLLKIVDFGVAKLLAGDPTSQVTRTGSWVGTPSYMSPEQARGETEVDARADVYALGVILYEMLSGKTPHRGDSFNAVIHNIATQPPAPLCAEGREFPRELEIIVERALSSNPSERQASAAELGQALAPFGRREVWAEPAERPPPTPVPEQESEDRAKAQGRRGRLVSWSLGVALLLLGTLWLATRSTTQTDADSGAAARRAEPPSALDAPKVPSRVPAPIARAAAENRLTPLDSVATRAAPAPSANGTSGRTAGRPPKNGVANPAAPKPAVSADVTATFDTRDPYE
jgi:serine/threonine-protein kinase